MLIENNKFEIPMDLIEAIENNKKFWQKGIWLDEPYYKYATCSETNLDCTILRHPYAGHLNAYIHLPESHPLYLFLPQEVTRAHDCQGYLKKFERFDVHNGVNFLQSGYSTLDPEKTPFLLVGFSPNNFEKDYWPGLFYDKKPLNGPEAYKNFEFMEKEVIKLAKQLKELEK